MPAPEMKVRIFTGPAPDVERDVNAFLEALPIGYGVAQQVIGADPATGTASFVFMLGIVRPNHVTPNGIERRIN